MSEVVKREPPAAEDPDVTSGLLEQARAIWKHRFLVLAIAVAAAAIVALWTLRQPKIYAASVTIEFDPSPVRPMGRDLDDVDAESSYYWSTHEYYTTQHHVIQSERVAEGVVRQLGLQHDADFLGVPLQDRRAFHSVSVIQAAGALRGRMSVAPVHDSRLVNIVVEDTSPRRAQLLANTIAAVYIRQNLENKLSTTVSALEWLGQQLDSLRAQLEQSEMALHNYRQQNNLLSTSFEERLNHVGNRIVKLSDSLTEIQIRRMQAEARAAELRRAAQSEDPLSSTAPELIGSTVISGLHGTYEQNRREHDSLATRYGENSAQMQQVNGRLREIEDAIRHEVRNVLGSAEAELRQIRRQETNLHASLAEAQHEGLELNLREIEYGRLLRERDNNAKLYGLVLERDKQTDLTRLSRVNNVRIIDDALLPGAPIKPRTLPNILLGVVGGIVLGILTAFALVQLDRTVRSPHDVEEELKATFLGMLPRVDGERRLKYRYRYGKAKDDEGPITKPELVVHTHPNSAVAEACRVIRTNLLFMSPDEPFRTLMVASADPREGKTTVAISLALTLAQSGKRVLLVDTDLRRPRIHRAFDKRFPVGVTSVLVNEATLDEAIAETDIPNLSLLPCGPIPPNPAELLHSQKFQDLLNQVKDRFDRIVFDTPPVGVVTDALIIGPQVDGVVVVARARSTVRARAASILGQLRSLGTRIAGVVLNDVSLGKEGGGYYYYARYEYGPRTTESPGEAA